MLGNAGRKQAINQSDCQNAGRKQDREKGFIINLLYFITINSVK